ncbi:hypothetical protein FOPG_04064 [Fusarium oxysporum f. sp. conglutinans race 2 54008]|uniref:Uncharacterized protein n=1 Tax=Fusarium oxysporum f. sp. conglutinans race 2 54008 TaxID=1089457 RepID=X0JDA2_FUSOX|nr:hypothetical protein FOPG_04064 [Fusarium oxysporum f. sp. conglutinans race 2 54008]
MISKDFSNVVKLLNDGGSCHITTKAQWCLKWLSRIFTHRAKGAETSHDALHFLNTTVTIDSQLQRQWNDAMN